MPKFMELTCVERVNTLLDGFRTGDAYLYARIEPYSLKYTVSEKKLYRQLDQCYKITPTQLQESSLFPSIPLSSAPSASLSSSSVPSVFKPSRPSLTSFSTTNLIRKRRLTFPSHKRHMLDSRSPSTSGVKPRSFESTSFSPESILCKRQRVGHYAKRLSFDELAKESGSRKILFYLIAILNASFPDYDFTDVPPFSFKRGNLEDLTSILESPIFALNDESKACAQDDLWDALNDACDQKLHESLVYTFQPLHEELDPLHEEGVLSSHLIFFCHFKLRRIIFLTLKIKTALTLFNPINRDESFDISYLPTSLIDENDP